MAHNEFDFYHEFSDPLLDFISRNGIFAYTENCDPEIDSNLLNVPKEFDGKTVNWNCLNTLLRKFSFGS
jgi:hypothetical protein